ncbi:cornifelin-like [Odontesthes bonariensis]|uniref:cornifelin-like n=1 Tax=Odontesthes bonariensis TaxID=219752 RepID=UPI003F58F3E5
MEGKPLTDWDSGLCDCFEDASTCCYGFWCCPCLACTVSGKFGESNCLPLCDICSPAAFSACGVPLFAPPAALSIRAAMRNRYGIKGSLPKDIASSCFCVWCSWCQMHREIKHRKKTPVVINMACPAIVNMPPPTIVNMPPPTVVSMQSAPVMMMPTNSQQVFMTSN